MRRFNVKPITHTSMPSVRFAFGVPMQISVAFENRKREFSKLQNRNKTKKTSSCDSFFDHGVKFASILILALLYLCSFSDLRVLVCDEGNRRESHQFFFPKASFRRHSPFSTAHKTWVPLLIFPVEMGYQGRVSLSP